MKVHRLVAILWDIDPNIDVVIPTKEDGHKTTTDFEVYVVNRRIVSLIPEKKSTNDTAAYDSKTIDPVP